MMQHHEQETRQTMPPMHEQLRALANHVGKCQTVAQAVMLILVMADAEEMRSDPSIVTALFARTRADTEKHLEQQNGGSPT